MNLSRLLRARAAAGNPVRVGLIGAGKFGSMFLAQARATEGLHLVGVADLSVERAREALARTAWEPERYGAKLHDEAFRSGATFVSDDSDALIAADGLEVIVEATGNPAAGIRHALRCFEYGRHVVMVNVEADVLAGPLLARRAAEAGVVYSMAYGDQPALICELVDWARACGFTVVAAGKGTKYLPAFHASTPDTVWQYYGRTPEQAKAGGMNPQMFNSFLDGTKSSIEMAAVSNATGLLAPRDGLAFPPCGVDELPEVLRPRSAGGQLEQSGMVEVISSVQRDGGPIERDLRWGVYVTFEGPSDYTARCFSEYGVRTDSSGRYTALYRPYHMIGLELGISVASAALRNEPTGSSESFNADVVAVAKRNLAEGEMLDGEGGYTVWGRLMRAEDSLATRALPIGLAHKLRLKRPIAEGAVVGWDDVDAGEADAAVKVRREMEAMFTRANAPAHA